jgi:hypothetical protein
MEQKKRGRPRTKIYMHNGHFVSRQRAWQVKQVEAGLCMYCPEPAGEKKGYCDHHYERMQTRRRALYAKRKEALQKV